MADIATLFIETLKSQSIPIVGVSFSVAGDRNTWTIQYDPSATDAQKATGESIRSTFDATAPAVTSAQLDRDADAALMTIVKAFCALLVDSELGRALVAGDGPTVRAKFTKFKTYFKYIVNNGL